jgi:ATP-dependent protease HslVU (ClpYQ) peptidase subunit
VTCIVGYKKFNKVWIAGDSEGSNSYMKTERKDKKVFKVGEFIFGCTTSFRMIQILKYQFNPPKRDKNKSLEEYIHIDVINHIQKLFLDNGYAEKIDNVVTGGDFLMGYKGKLFYIYDDFQVGEDNLNYSACGSGEACAKGALFVLDKTEEKVEVILKKAIGASKKHCVGVGGKINIIHT